MRRKFRDTRRRSQRRSQRRSRRRAQIVKHQPQKTGTYKQLRARCSANVPNRHNPFTCYNPESVQLLVDVWNKSHPSNPIRAGSSKEQWYMLKRKLSNQCGVNEMCWLAQPFAAAMKIRLMRAFAKGAPKEWLGKNVWLSDIEIEEFLRACEEKFERFRFVGPSAIDFDTATRETCVFPELCKFNLARYVRDGVTDVGIVFNTDKHTGSGQHWIALYFRISGGVKSFYFDSTGARTPPQIGVFIERIHQQAKDLGVRFSADSNQGTVHQKSTSECGIYCMYFIWSILTRRHKSEDFKRIIITDSEIQEYRWMFFNHPDAMPR